MYWKDWSLDTEYYPQIGTWIQGVRWLRREEVESRRLRRYRKASYKVLGVGHWGRARSTGIEMASLQWRHSYLSVLELVTRGKVHRYSMPFPLFRQPGFNLSSKSWLKEHGELLVKTEILTNRRVNGLSIYWKAHFFHFVIAVNISEILTLKHAL